MNRFLRRNYSASVFIHFIVIIKKNVRKGARQISLLLAMNEIILNVGTNSKVSTSLTFFLVLLQLYIRKKLNDVIHQQF